jgi:hypothetical protein
MLGFSAVASTPIAALPAAVNNSITVSASGVFGTATLGDISLVVSSPVVSSGFLLGFGPIAATPIAAITSASSANIIANTTGVFCTASLGSTVVYIPNTPVVLPVDGVYAIAFLGSVVVGTVPTITVKGVYATAKVGSVAVRAYSPKGWTPISTAGGHFPNWQQIST